MPVWDNFRVGRDTLVKVGELSESDMPINPAIL